MLKSIPSGLEIDLLLFTASPHLIIELMNHVVYDDNKIPSQTLSESNVLFALSGMDVYILNFVILIHTVALKNFVPPILLFFRN